MSKPLTLDELIEGLQLAKDALGEHLTNPGETTVFATNKALIVMDIVDVEYDTGGWDKAEPHVSITILNN